MVTALEVKTSYSILESLNKIDNLTKKAKELGYNSILITGNPEYYKKYGFESASKYGIYYDGMENGEAPFFMIKVLDDKKINELKGTYNDPSCYNVDEEELLKELNI